jgi:hypothetical protein
MKLIGKNGISAEMIAYSCDTVCPDSKVMTVSVKYGLIIHAEFLRHRTLSRGVKSNRAIPMNIIRKEVLSDPYIPVWFGAVQRGMVSDREMKHKWFGKQVWLKSRYLACGAHWLAEKLGAHKEWANRLLNPWQWVRETITATEWDNLYNLRIHKDAQKDIRVVVELIEELSRKCEPEKLFHGWWHTPYVKHKYDDDGKLQYIDNDGKQLTLEEAKKASAARCARSSYDKHDGTQVTLEQDLPLYEILVDCDPKHASPVEHQATPMVQPYNSILAEKSEPWENGLTHMDYDGNFWSGNLKGWVQHRQLLNNHTCYKYKGV